MTLARLSAIVVTLSTITSAAHACVVTSTTEAPAYPSDAGFSISGLISLNEATEVITLRHTPNSPPDGFDARTGCPHEDAGLLNWEDASTWTTVSLPADGQDVTLPENARVLVGGCSVPADTIYGKITVPASSELIFADEDIVFNTTGILVQGKLTLGSETCRLHSQISITLHGSRPDELPAPAWYKGIAAVGSGVLDIHGSIFHPTWTRLAATAAAGDTQIYLQHRVNWQPGQRLVLTGTEIKDSRDWHRNEERSIASVELSGEFSRVTLTAPLDYTHYGGSEYQGEVGLLSRNIVIQGDASSEPTDTDNDICQHSSFGTYPCEHKWLTGFGGHTIAMGPDATTRFEGVELYRMGQTNVLARYPWHVHIVGEGGHRSYLKHSSMHHTFYRCATIHGTNNTLIQDNVAFDAIGHCFYSGEDGVEEKNTLAYNLASHVHFMEYPRTAGAQFMDNVYSSDSLTQPADTTASGFYITNAFNTYIGNAASGGYAGFAIVKMPKAIMAFRDVEFASGMSPSERPFIEFDGNSCHSTGFWWVMGGCIYVGGNLQHADAESNALVYNPGREVSGRSTKCQKSPTSTAVSDCDLVFSNTKIFLANYGLNNWGARSTIDGLEAHDVTRAIAILGYHYVHNVLTVCKSQTFTPEQPGSKYYERRWFNWHMGFEWYDVHQRHIIDGITFRNCGDAASNSPVWRFLTHSDTYVPGFLQATRNVKYENVDRSMIIRPSVSNYLAISGYLSNWLDADGSVLGAADGSSGAKIIGAAREGIEWWRLDDDCTLANDIWYNCDRISAATGNRRGVASFTVVFDDALHTRFKSGELCGNGNKIACPRVGSVVHLGYQDPSIANEAGLPIKANAVVTGPANGLGWLFLFDAGSPVSASFRLAQIDEDDNVLIAMPYPAGVAISLRYVAASWCSPSWGYCDHEFTAAASLAEVLDSNGDMYFFDTARGLLYFRFIQQKMGTLDFSEPPAYGNLGTSYFQHSDVRIPPIMWGGTLELRVSGCTLNATNAAYCAKSAFDASAVCEDLGHGIGSTAEAFDHCVAPAESPPTDSPTDAPTTMAPTATPTKLPTTMAPTAMPTNLPTTMAPTATPTNLPTTMTPTAAPTDLLAEPTCTVSAHESLYIGPTRKTKISTVGGIATLGACQQKCRDTAECGAYNHQIKRKKCMLLRRDTHEVLSKTGYTSGLVECPGDAEISVYCRNKNTGASGTTLQVVQQNSNYRACQRLCRNTTGCAFYLFHADQKCELLSALESSFSASGKTFGPRDCY